MISPEKRAELKSALVSLIERVDPSRAGRADEMADGIIMTAEIVPKLADALARSRVDEGTAVPPIDVALKTLVDHTSGNVPDIPEHEERSEAILSKTLDQLRLERPGPISGPIVIDGLVSLDEKEGMRLLYEAIKRSRGFAPRFTPGQGKGDQAIGE